MRTVLVLVADTTGAPVTGASVKIDDRPNPAIGTTDAQGMCPLLVSEIPQSHLWITATGYADYAMHLELPTTNVQIRVGVGPDPDRHGDVILPPLEVLRPSSHVPTLAVDGQYLFDTATGRRLCLNGTDQFQALRLTLDGQDRQIDALIRESQELRFNVWRVFCAGSIAQNRMMDLWPQREFGYWHALEDLTGTLNDAGIIPFYDVFVDNQDVQLPIADHWSQFHGVLAHYQKIVSGGNEASKNGFDPQALSVPPVTTPVWARGSEVTEPHEPTNPNGATLALFHPRRDFPVVLNDTVASAVNFWFQRRWHVPMFVDEPPRMGTDGSGDVFMVPETCGELAAGYRVRCAGAVFHSRCGQRSVPFDVLTRLCAERWSCGMGNGQFP